MSALSEEEKGAIAAAWLERTAQAYPPQTALFLLAERDRFRNPVGHAFRQVLPVLFDELAGNMDPARITPVLDEIMHIRAVQYFTAEEAIGFVFLLRDVLAQHRPDLGAALKDRIECLAQMAVGEFGRCQQRIREIKSREAVRRVYVRWRRGVAPGEDGAP